MSPSSIYGSTYHTGVYTLVTSLVRMWVTNAALSSNDFYTNVTTLRSGLCRRKSVCRLSVCNVGAPCSGDQIFLHRCVRWPSSDLCAKFYGDRHREIPLSEAL